MDSDSQPLAVSIQETQWLLPWSVSCRDDGGADDGDA